MAAVVSNNSDLSLGVIPIDATINSENALIDSDSWTEISGNFIAQGDERFLTIGNIQLETIDTFLQAGQFNAIYYYLDDVGVFENFVMDTILCPYDTLILKTDGAQSHLWQDNSTDSTFTVTQAGVYWNQATYNNITHTDTFKVSYYDPLSIITTSDITICYDESVTLSVSQNFEDVEYNWSTGDTTSSIVVSNPGTYSISISNICEKQGDVITVQKRVKIEFELGNDTSLCFNNTLLLEPKINEGEYQWQDGSNELSYLIEETDWYSLTISNVCEKVSDSIYAFVYDKLELDFGDNRSFCEPPYTININSQDASILWSDGSTKNYYDINKTEEIWLTLTNECESVSDTVRINHFCGCEPFVPKAFTPNKDNINDHFNIVYDRENCNLILFELQIFNRWGQKVFYSNSYDEKWDGSFNCELLPSGVYIYKLNYKFPGDREKTIIDKVVLTM